MKKIYVLLFTLIVGFSQIKLNAQCNLSATLNAVPDSAGSFSYTITASVQNASPFASSYLTINPGPTFYGQNTVNYTFPFGGSFVVCYTVNDSSNVPSGNCSYTVCDTVVVGSSNSCGAFIQANNNGGGGFTFTGIPNTPNGWNVSYTWSFGDGTSSSLNPATHNYAVNGTYTVCLYTTATDPLNSSNTCSGSSCQAINVQGVNNGGGGITCNSGFNFYNLGNGNFSFVNTSYCSDSSAISNYNWTIDGVQFSTMANPNYVVTDTLPHYVCLGQLFYNPTTGDSCYSGYCDTIQPAGGNNGGGNPSTCQAGFVLWQDSLNPSIYYGYNTSTGSNTMIYVWDFGDGTTATGPFPTHTYATTGAYNVCLTVVDSINNCTSTYCDSAGVFKIMNPGISQITILPSLSTGLINYGTDFSALLSPNPVNEYTSLKVNSSHNRKIELQIFDVSGRKLMTEEVLLNAGKNEIKLTNQHFSEGIYLIRLIEKGKLLQTIRFVK